MASKSQTTGFWKALGPGLLFASTAIGTSHLIFSTKAGAEYGLIFAIVIAGALFANYPFFEYSGRYANGTGRSLFHGYRNRGPRWLVLIFGLLMVNVVGNAALVTVSEGLLAAVLGIDTVLTIGNVGIPLWLILLVSTWGILLVGRFEFLDRAIKALVILLFFTTLVTFCAVLYKGPIEPRENFVPPELLTPGGIALLIALMGYMPTPLYVSIFQSVWSETKYSTSQYRPTLSEQLLDFRIGYVFTMVMAFVFLIVGVFTLYGSGQSLSDNNTKFAAQVVGVFTMHIGSWAYPIVGATAFAAIYGTFITSFDAFGRSITGAFFAVQAGDDEDKQASVFGNMLKFYPLTLTLITLYIIFVKIVLTGQNGFSMGQILRVTAIIAFLCSPIIAFLNFRSVLGDEMPETHKPGPILRIWSWFGLVYISVFAIIYILHRLGVF